MHPAGDAGHAPGLGVRAVERFVLLGGGNSNKVLRVADELQLVRRGGGGSQLFARPTLTFVSQAPPPGTQRANALHVAIWTARAVRAKYVPLVTDELAADELRAGFGER
ncbi:hypothetical protein ACFFTM_24465 [Pseudoduganella plicata]|nr:hypothetical protein [Pseudoduganella plicata]QBQ37396.1 hypothetical protein E1742_15405 [Pseudoduganella plicata]